MSNQHLNKIKPDFLTSCFNYYRQNIFKESSSSNKTKTKTLLSKSFREIKTTPLIVIDYPNIIYILHKKYKSQEEVAKHFYRYLYKCQSRQKTKKTVVAICKSLTINEKSYNVDLLLNLGYRFIKKPLSFTNLFIYQIDYDRVVSSSMDDLLGYFVSFVSLFYYGKTNNINITDPTTTNKKVQKHIQYLTNDKQHFNKNLFGKTREEISDTPLLIFEKMNIHEKGHVYQLEKDPINEKHISNFLKEYMVLRTEDTKGLESDILKLIHTFDKNKNIQERKSWNMTYKKMNQSQNQIKKNNKTRKIQHHHHHHHHAYSLKDGKLQPSYYLYALLKYTQLYLKGDFYGSYSQKEINELFD